MPRRFNADQLQTLPAGEREGLVALLLRTAHAYFESDADQLYRVIGNVTLLMGRLVSLLESESAIRTDDLDKQLKENRVERIVNYIDENYRQKITLAKLAEMENISTTYLSHFFTKTFGVSFHVYLSRLRFEKALVLLRNKSFPLVDICMNCGFSDTRYLEAACRRTFGCSVSEYRKRCSEEIEEDGGRQEDGLLVSRYSRRESRDFLRRFLGEEQYQALAR